MNDREWMQIALEEARTAFCENEVPVGAIVVKDQTVIARAHNLCESQNDPTLHAEMLVLREAYQKLGSLSGCTLYVTLEPCAMCIGAMLHDRLPRLVYGAFDAQFGCCGSRIDLGDHWIDHSIETIGGILADECADLIKEFFKTRRSV